MGYPSATHSRVVDGAYDTSGKFFPLGSCARTYAYSGGFISTDTATDGTNTWVKTFGNDGTNLTTETGWVRQ